MARRQQPEQLVLRAVGVLVLVDQDVPVPVAVVGAELRFPEHLDRPQQQVVEVEGVGLAEAPLVAVVD